MSAADNPNDPEHLIVEHYSGRYSDLLGMAQEFLNHYRATCGEAGGEADIADILEATDAWGFTEEEITAVLMMEEGSFRLPSDPRGVGETIK